MLSSHCVAALVMVAALLPATAMQLQQGLRKDPAVSSESVEEVAAQPLPSLHTVLREPTDTFNALMPQVDALLARLKKEADGRKHLVSEQLKEYEAQLADQRNTTHSLKVANSDLSDAIKQEHGMNELRRVNARAIRDANAILTKTISHLQGNLTFAQEFANATVTDVTASDQDAVLDVLGQLDKADSVANEQAAHDKHLKDVGRSDRGVSLLQDSDSAGHDSKGVVESLVTSLADVDTGHANSLADLNASFQVAFSAGSEKIGALKAEHAELKEKLKATTLLGERLETAVEHLRKAHSALDVKVQALHTFAARLGAAGAHLDSLVPNGKRQQSKTQTL